MIREIKVFGRDLRVHLESDADLSVFEEIFVDRDYKIVDEILKRAKVVIDVGAHLGFFSLYCGCLNSEVKIFSFEPEERNYRFLKENLRENRVKNVVSKNSAVSDVVGEVELNLSGDSHNHSLVLGFDGEKKRIFSTTLQTICNKFGIEKCDLVKLDCEGAEFKILENLDEETFKKIGAFVVEYHEYLPEMKKEKLVDILTKRGFKVQIFPSHYDRRMGMILARYLQY